VFYPIRPTEKGLIGFSACLFDNRLSLSSIAVYTKPNGDIRLVFPDRTLPNSRKINIFFPINNETYEVIKEAIVKKIEALVEKVRVNNEQEEK